jgi:hypothetical protein
LGLDLCQRNGLAFAAALREMFHQFLVASNIFAYLKTVLSLD